MVANSSHVVPIQEGEDEISVTKPAISQENKPVEVNQSNLNTQDLEMQSPSNNNGASFARTCLNLTNAVSGCFTNLYLYFYCCR
jgi:hypothetical protein